VYRERAAGSVSINTGPSASSTLFVLFCAVASPAKRTSSNANHVLLALERPRG
jgi:hypothetical protein